MASLMLMVLATRVVRVKCAPLRIVVVVSGMCTTFAAPGVSFTRVHSNSNLTCGINRTMHVV